MSKILEPITESVEILRCQCGDSVCTKFVLSSGYGGRFGLADAKLYQHAPRLLQELKTLIETGALTWVQHERVIGLIRAIEATELDH